MALKKINDDVLLRLIREGNSPAANEGSIRFTGIGPIGHSGRTISEDLPAMEPLIRKMIEDSESS